MSEPTLLFAAIANPEGQPEGAIQFQINQDTLGTPDQTGELLHVLQLHLAQALVDKGTSPDPVKAFDAITQGNMAALDRTIADQATAQNTTMGH